MGKSLDFFELFNNWLREKEKILNRHKPLWLINSTFKGIGQILFCCNSISGLLFLGGFASGWWVIVPYCIAGCAVSTLTAFFLRQKAVLIGMGLFGYNGALIGLTWPFFWPFSYFSPLLLILASGLSTLLTIVLMGLMSNNKTNLPVLSIPFVIIFLIFLGSAYASGLLSRYPLEPTPPSLESLDLAGAHQRLINAKEWLRLGKELLHNAVTIGVFFVGILLYSRISALCAFFGASISIIIMFLLMGPQGLYQLGLHGFTSVPIAIALGGFFVVLNVPGVFYALFATLLGIFLWFIIAPLLAPQGIPVLTIVFNIIILMFIFPLRQPFIALKIPWLYAVSLSHAIRPEDTLRWYKLHRYAARYWDNVK